MPSDAELKLIAVMYASRPGVLEHVRRTGELPKEIPMGGASIQTNHVFRTRGAEPVLTEDEGLVHDALLRAGRSPGGRVIPVTESGSAGAQGVKQDAHADGARHRLLRTKQLFYRRAENENLVFASPEEAMRIHQIRVALATARTWGEFRALMPSEDYDELREQAGENAGEDEEAFPADEEAFESDRIAGYSDGDYPDWLQARADRFLPREVLDRFGVEETTVLNGNYWNLDPENEAAIVEALAQCGFQAVKREDLDFF